SYIGGRAKEAIDEAERAYELDPLSPVIALARALAYCNDRQFYRAIEVSRKIIADDPRFGRAHAILAFSYWGEHKYVQAIQEYKAGAQLEGDKDGIELTTAEEAGYRSGGLPLALRKAIEVATAQRKNGVGYVSPFVIARLYAQSGDKNHAFEWLNTAYQERDSGLVTLRP